MVRTSVSATWCLTRSGRRTRRCWQVQPRIRRLRRSARWSLKPPQVGHWEHVTWQETGRCALRLHHPRLPLGLRTAHPSPPRRRRRWLGPRRLPPLALRSKRGVSRRLPRVLRHSPPLVEFLQVQCRRCPHRRRSRRCHLHSRMPCRRQHVRWRRRHAPRRSRRRRDTRPPRRRNLRHSTSHRTGSSSSSSTIRALRRRTRASCASACTALSRTETTSRCAGTPTCSATGTPIWRTSSQAPTTTCGPRRSR
mmetsp:Transcript_3526/g.7955  ORF Transcript_3526/g.7955 Transcript_3526/m.7955 type:complete len:251 (-) Transcript_3526:391-1143(-)